MKGSPDLSTLVYGKVPPQARDLEEAVLGAIMLEREAFDMAIEFLKAESFYVDSHQRIFGAMMGLAQRNSPIDILTVVEELRKRDELEVVGGPYFVTKLTNSVVSSAHIEAHCKILVQKFMQRELIRISGHIIGDAYEDSTDAFDLLENAEAALFEIGAGSTKSEITDTATMAVQAMNDLEALMATKNLITGVPTGYMVIDTPTGGWQKTDLIIIAARPSVGKTAFALNLAKNAAMHPVNGCPVGFFSLEMSKKQIMNRLLSMESLVHLDNITRGRLEEYQAQKVYLAAKKLIDTPLFFDDSAGLSLFDFRAKARRMVARHKVGLIIVDYLQLMSGGGKGGGNREQEISEISRGLKGVAKDLQVPIIALSQLNRAVEARKDGVPVLADLRESGAIEQDADMVGFLYRPDYQQEAHKVDPAFRNDAFFKIAKHRNGSLETLSFKTDLRVQTWFDLDGWQEYTGQAAPVLFTPAPAKPLPVPQTPAVRDWHEQMDGEDLI